MCNVGQNMKTTILFILLLGAPGRLPATETNAPAARPATNAPVNLAERPRAEQLAAVITALKSYMDEETDPVTYQTTVRQNGWNNIYSDTGPTLRLSVAYFMGADRKLPPQLVLFIRCADENWQFLKRHEITFRVDDEKINFGNCQYSGEVVDGGVVEKSFVYLDWEQFRKFAWASTIYFSYGDHNYQILGLARQKWKLLWKYHDLKTEPDPVVSPVK